LPDSEQEQLPPKRVKGVYVGAPACFALELACQHLAKAFGGYGLYLVGSAMQRPDWRDVDVRFILSDEEFAALFPDAGRNWEFDPRWLVLTVAISKWLSDQSGLPVDFQFQPMTHANERHGSPRPRNALGLSIVNERPEPAPELEIARGDMRWAKEQRMKFIAARLGSEGFINRRHIQDEFGVSAPQASADLSAFAKLKPGTMTYNPSTKRFERAA